MLPEEKQFHFRDGSAVGDLAGLKDKIEAVGYEEFYHHVNDEKNDFANWIRHSLGQEAIAGEVEKVTSIVETVEILNDHLAPRPVDAPHEDIQSQIEEALDIHPTEEPQATPDHTPETAPQDTPEVSETPAIPETPDMPAAPDMPEIPEVPDTPDVSAAPDVPPETAAPAADVPQEVPAETHTAAPDVPQEVPAETHDTAPTASKDHVRMIVKDFMYGLVFGLIIGIILGRMLSF